MRKITILVTAMLLFTIVLTFNPMIVESQDVQPETMIKGTVYDSKTGEPIDWAMVRLFIGVQNFISHTDPNGGYEFALQVVYKEDYEICASKEGYYDQWKSGEISRGDILIIDFNLDPFPARIFGYVKDKVTEEPIEEALIFALSCDGGEDSHTYSDENGFYETFVEAGTSVVYCDMNGYEQYWSDEFVIEEGQELELNINMVPIETGVFGMVTNDGGGAILGAYVTVYNDRHWEYDHTDNEGKYDIRIPPGEYNIVVSKDDYFDHEDTIIIPEDEMLEYDVVLEEITVTGMLRYIVDLILEAIGGIF